MTDRLRTQAKDSPWQLGDLQRQYAYDQLVERLYRLDDRWVITSCTDHDQLTEWLSRAVHVETADDLFA